GVYLSLGEIRLNQFTIRVVLGRVHAIGHGWKARHRTAEGVVVVQDADHIRMAKYRGIAITDARHRATRPHGIVGNYLILLNSVRARVPDQRLLTGWIACA